MVAHGIRYRNWALHKTVLLSARKLPGEHSKTTKTARRTLQDHVLTRRTLWCWFNQTRTTCKNRWTLWRRFNQTRTTCINQWLTLYKLTGWLASLDLRKSNLAIQNTSSNTKITIPYTFTFCCRGFVCFFVCLFVWAKPENLFFSPCVWREVMEVIIPGNGCSRNQAQKLSFTQDGLAFSTKTVQRTLQDHVRDTKNTVVQI